MKKTIPNPEYKNADWCLDWIVDPGTKKPPEIRFNGPIPPDIERNSELLNRWIADNAIAPFIEVEE